MRWLRENILRIMSLTDIAVSTFLLLIYLCTGNVKIIMSYYIANFGLLLIVLAYAISLFYKRDRIEKTRRHIHKVEEREK